MLLFFSRVTRSGVILLWPAQPSPERLPTYRYLMVTENPAAGLAWPLQLPWLVKSKGKKSEARDCKLYSPSPEGEAISNQEHDLPIKHDYFIAG